MIEIPQPLMEQLIAAIITFLSIVVAIWKNSQANTATVQVAALTPGTPESTSPEVIAKLPDRSWKMAPETLHYIQAAESDADKASIERQVRDAEAQHLVVYQIQYSKGGYVIEYGLIKESWRGK